MDCNILNLYKDRINKRILALCQEQILCGEKIGIAISGGADSVFLLLSAVQYFGKDSLIALHYNHKVRKSADNDELFVRNLCASLGVKLVCESRSGEIKNTSEGSLREIRLGFFVRKAAENNITLIAQGHHLNDVSETLIMRIMRGASPDGLCAPRAISKYENVIFIRPLLGLEKLQIKDALKSLGQSWCEDETNACDKYLRNKIRHNVVPVLESVSERDFAAMAGQCRALLEEREVFFESYCNAMYKLFKLSENTIVLNTPFRTVQRTLIAKFLVEKHGELSFKAMNLLLDTIAANEDYKCSVKCGFLEFSAKSRQLSLANAPQEAADYQIDLSLGENVLPDGSLIFLEFADFGENAKERAKKESNVFRNVCVKASAFPLRARNKRAGDAYTYIGLKSPKKLQDIFVDKKVEKLKRNAFPVVIDSMGEIVWTVSAPPAAKYALEKGDKVLRIIYEYKE